MEKGNGIKATLFVIFILAVIVGGYILMKQSEKKLDAKPQNNTEEKSEIKDIRLDKTKDYVYFTNYEEKVHELDIIYKDINLNFKDLNNIAKLLNDESKELKETMVYDETNEDAPYDNLVSAKYKIYTTYSYDNYISIIVDYFSYHYETLVSYLYSKTYVFDKNTGSIVTNDDLLNKYNLTKDDVINKVKNHIADEDVLKNEEELDEEATVAQMTELSLFIDKIGRLSISVLVKSDQKDYNEIIILS